MGHHLLLENVDISLHQIATPVMVDLLPIEAAARFYACGRSF